MSSLVEKIVLSHRHLADADIPHAFGGALALAWCTHAARGTIDIDLNLFVSVDQVDQVIAALPPGVSCTTAQLKQLKRDTQVRLFWEATPVDLFLNSTPFHNEVQHRIRWEEFSGQHLPFLGCADLAVFKAFFNRTKDWADLEEMYTAGTLPWQQVAGVLIEYLGADDERVTKLKQLATRSTP